MNQLGKEECRENFTYDSELGMLRWKVVRNKQCRYSVNDIAGNPIKSYFVEMVVVQQMLNI